MDITDEIIENLERAGVGELVSEEKRAFALKDHMMMAFIERIDKRQKNPELELEDQISCGMAKDEKGGHVLVIDLPYFGQFSVHMQDKKTISAMRSNIYDKFVYSLESAMITEEKSAATSEDINKVNGMTIKDGFNKGEAAIRVARERVQNDKLTHTQNREDEARKLVTLLKYINAQLLEGHLNIEIIIRVIEKYGSFDEKLYNFMIGINAQYNEVNLEKVEYEDIEELVYGIDFMYGHILEKYGDVLK